VATATLTGARLKKVLAALNENWHAEVEAYHTYLTLAERDTEPVRAQVLRHLATAEWEHAQLWHGRIIELGGPEPVYSGKPGGEADSLANRAGGVRMALRRLEIEESRHIATYGEQLKALGDEGSIAILDHVIEDEKDHYRELGSLLRGHYTPPAGAPKIDPKAVLEELLAKRAKGRKQPGAWIGDAIYGVNDGLGAIFGIVSGVSGATAGDSKYVLLAGLSGMIASALSMGSGARGDQDERAGSARAALALLPGEGPAGGRRAAHGEPHCQRPGAAAAGAGQRAVGVVGRGAEQSAGFGQLGGAVNGDWREYSDHSLLLYERD